MKILIVEDDSYAAEILKKILENLGYKVFIAQDGLEAWEAIQRSPFRMVITDWMMPRIDGVTLCQKIRETNFGHYVYVMIVTAKDKRDDAIVGLDAGADDYIIKPFEPNELIARTRTGQRVIQLEDDHKQVYQQLLQSEKMSSIGQLAAGVAHEINNPTGFVSSNLQSLSDYQNDLNRLIPEYRRIISLLEERFNQGEPCPDLLKQIQRIRELEEEIDFEFVLADTPKLIQESNEGTERIKKIVMDLKDFAHPGEDKLMEADINKSLDSTLNVVWNELKYKAEVIKEYGDVPAVPCFPQQLNQVFVNILVNAAQAIEDKGEIKIATRADNRHVEIQISDTGQGIAEENISKVFDPFFTTKDVGKGTGLGLNVSYNIVKKHGGTIDVQSEVGKGSTFTVRVPVSGN